MGWPEAIITIAAVAAFAYVMGKLIEAM